MPPATLLSDLVPETPEAGVGTPESPSDFASIRKRIFGGGSKTSKVKSPKKSDDGEMLAREVENLFAGENFAEISALYFNARYAITGFDGFLLSEAQKKVLGLSLATSMRLLIKIDPGYLALLIFTTNFGGIIAQKEMQYKAIVKEMEKNAGKKSS